MLDLPLFRIVLLALNQLRQLSTQCIQRDAYQSSHFVWIDEPELIVNAIQDLLNNPHCPP